MNREEDDDKYDLPHLVRNFNRERFARSLGPEARQLIERGPRQLIPNDFGSASSWADSMQYWANLLQRNSKFPLR